MNENLRAAYAELAYVEKHSEAVRKQAMSAAQPSEAETGSARSLLAHGYGVTHGLSQASANEQTIQMGAAEVDDAIAEMKRYTAYVEEQIAKLNGGTE